MRWSVFFFWKTKFLLHDLLNFLKRAWKIILEKLNAWPWVRKHVLFFLDSWKLVNFYVVRIISTVWFLVLNIFLKTFKIFIFFYFKLIFFSVFKLFWCVHIKNNFLKIKIYYFNIFLNKKKHFKKQLKLYLQTSFSITSIIAGNRK